MDSHQRWSSKVTGVLGQVGLQREQREREREEQAGLPVVLRRAHIGETGAET